MSDRNPSPWENPKVIGDVIAELSDAYEGTDYRVPHFVDVLEHALEPIAADMLSHAEELASCNKVDECTAEAIVLKAFVEWLRVEIAERRERSKALDELVRLSEEMGLYDRD